MGESDEAARLVHVRGAFGRVFLATEPALGGRQVVVKVAPHAGGIPGFSSLMLRLPDEKFTVGVLANANPFRPNADPYDLAHQMVDIYLADKLAPPIIVNTNASPNRVTP